MQRNLFNTLKTRNEIGFFEKKGYSDPQIITILIAHKSILYKIHKGNGSFLVPELTNY